jgi:hypothetical protein
MAELRPRFSVEAMLGSSQGQECHPPQLQKELVTLATQSQMLVMQARNSYSAGSQLTGAQRREEGRDLEASEVEADQSLWARRSLSDTWIGSSVREIGMSER